jgi:2,4-dienoyl-CoA reductase-like NADH-dependent reductase (Old Yellow Enzyme family)
LTVRHWTFRNRIVMPPMVSVRDITKPDGIEWYARHAAGGPGLVIIEATGVPRFGDDIRPETLRPVVAAIHRGGALAAIQLFPVRFGSNPSVADTTKADIRRMLKEYKTATEICLDAGMDGVEPHGAHGYLLNRFFSPADNPRPDNYSASGLENRMRFGLEIVRTVRKAAGNRMLVLYRHTPVKDGSYGIADSIAFARELVNAGVDVLDVSPSSQNAPGEHSAPFVGFGAAVIAVGCLDEPGRATEALGEKRADLVAIGRALIADPDWSEKVRTGKRDRIVRCTRCNVKCFGNLKKGIPIACTQWEK